MKTDVTIHTASEADLDALVRLAVAFRDHVGESIPSVQEFCASLVVLLHDASAEFFLASTHTGAAVGYVQCRYLQCRASAPRKEKCWAMNRGMRARRDVIYASMPWSTAWCRVWCSPRFIVVPSDKARWRIADARVAAVRRGFPEGWCSK